MAHFNEGLKFVFPKYYNFLSQKEVEKENKELREENARLKKELEKLKKFNRVKINFKLTEELEVAKEELQSTKTELSEVKERLEKATEENSTLKNQNEELKKTINKLERELEIVQNSYKTLKEKYEKLERDLPILREVQSGISFSKLKEISKERIDELIKLKLLEVGYSEDMEELKKKYSQERLCNLLGITLEFPLQKRENFREVLSMLLTLRNEFEKLSLEIVEEAEWSKKAYKCGEWYPGYKYYWKLKVPKIDVFLFSSILQYIQAKTSRLAEFNIEEFLKIIDLLYTLDQILIEAGLEEKYLSVVTDEKRIIESKHMEKLDEKIKERWTEKIRVFSEIKKDILLNLCILLQKLNLLAEGESEKAKAIEYIPPKEEIKPKSKVELKAGKLKVLEGREIEIPAKKLEKLNDNEKIMFELMQEKKSVESLTTLTKLFNEKAGVDLSKAQIARIFDSVCEKLTFYTEIEGKKVKIKPLFKEGKAPNVSYRFLS